MLCFTERDAGGAGRVDESKAVRIGEFTVSHGVQTGVFSIEGPQMIERIKNDTNRLLTLIIAGNRHPMLPPPTLRVR